MEAKQPYLFQMVVTMSDVWRIFVVESDISLNQNLVNSLRKDGYVVQGAVSSADAMRTLWSEEYDLVICDLNLPDADGLELLRWLRAYRSNMRPIVLGPASSTEDGLQRLQALESGAISYMEKPVDLRLLKDELRRLLQQTGFTASLDSFDLLDVIQIITASRKSIALLVNTGLEERGMLRFQNGDLVWAEYGVLRGEEAFFALAAHKNGTVTQQASDEQFATNVTQPLSRLIFQALQYRTKYANTQQPTSGPPGQGSVGTGFAPVQSQANVPGNSSSPIQFLSDEVDDRPFVFTSEGIMPSDPSTVQQMSQGTNASATFSAPQEPVSPMAQFEPPVVGQQKEWWQVTGQMPKITGEQNNGADDLESVPTSALDLRALREAMNASQASSLEEEMGGLGEDSSQLPSWLTEQPTSARIPIQAPTHFSSSVQMPPSPISPPVSDEALQIQAMQSAQVSFKTTDDLLGSQKSTVYMQAFAPETEERRPSSPQRSQEQPRPSSSPQHGPAGQSSGVFEHTQGRQSPQGAVATGLVQGTVPVAPVRGQASAQVPDGLRESNPVQSSTPSQPQREVTRKNYAALVSALQTLGYSIPGFIAAAVVDIDSSPIAQVAIDDADISQIWQLLSVVQRSALDALQSAEWGVYEETVMTTASRHVLMRVIGTDKKAFFVLITTREANFTESLEIMANVEGAISAALR